MEKGTGASPLFTKLTPQKPRSGSRTDPGHPGKPIFCTTLAGMSASGVPVWGEGGRKVDGVEIRIVSIRRTIREGKRR
jgi:hypothetical protein